MNDIIELAYQDSFYKYPEKCADILKENDKNLFKEKVECDFYQILANCSTDLGFKSNGGHRIKFSYCSWREAFFDSTDRNDLKFLESLYTTSGAMNFSMLNVATNKYDYIISLNSDCYNNISCGFTILTYFCQLGRCLLDYPLHNKGSDNKRNIDKIISADTAGLNAMKSYIICNVNHFKNREHLLGAEGFRLKHICNCGMVIYGEENMNVISNTYGLTLQDTLKLIAERFVDFDSGETSEEDKAREENFKKFLSENL